MVKHMVQTLAATIALALQAHAGLILNFFPASDYNVNTATMDAALETTGFTVDSFETTTLIPGLTATLSGGVPLTTFASLPSLFDTTNCGALSGNAQWDGTDVLVNTTTNTLSSCTNPANIASLSTLNYAPGTTSFGVGFGNFQSVGGPVAITNHELFVNGTDQGVLEALAGANWTAGLARNAYLRVDGTAGTLITSVAVENLTGQDVLFFDHVAVQSAASSAPEASTAWCTALAIVLLVLYRLLGNPGRV